MKFGLMLVVAVSGMWLLAEPKTLYVDSNLTDYTNQDGSEETPYETIQQAIENADGGDTILVRPGRYSKGGDDATHTRVNIVDKPGLLVKSLGDKTDTFIVGAHADTKDHLGDDAWRCVSVSGSDGARIEGFTLCDGSTKSTSGEDGYTGGFRVLKNKTNVYLVDCDIVNCTAKAYSGCYFGTLIRCRLHHNQSWNGGIQLCRQSRLYCCIVDSTKGTPSGNVISHCPMVHCTVTCNYINGSAIDGVGTYCYNTIVEASGKWNASVPTANVVGSVISANDSAGNYNAFGYYLIAPSLGDFRVRVGGGADLVGDPQYASGTKVMRDLPTDCQGLDFNRNPIGSAGATVIAGAVQETVRAAGNGVAFMSEAYADSVVVDGGAATFPGNTGYFFPTNYPTLYRLQPLAVPGSGQHFYYLDRTTAKGGVLFPDRNDVVCLMPEPGDGSEVVSNTFRYVTKVVWADPKADPAVANGTESRPYATLQAAIESSFDKKIVYARPGVYDRGSRVCSWNAESRVSFEEVSGVGNYGCRVVATDGPEKTFIVGAPDPSTGGNGENAVCCVICRTTAQVLGFTLTGGYEPASGNTGGGYESPGYNLYLTDCIISNNFGTATSAGFGATLVRCLVADNHGGSSCVCKRSYLSSCIVRDNAGPAGVQFNNECRIVNSTVVSDSDKELFESASASLRANSVFSGGSTARAAASADVCGGNVYWGFSACDDMTGRVGDPELGAFGAMKLPYPSMRSAAIGAGVAPTVSRFGAAYSRLAWTDFADVVPTYSDGAPTVSGALVTPRKCVSVSIPGGSVSVIGGHAGVNDVAALSDTLTVAPAEGARPVSGVIVNGVTNLFETLEGHVWSVTPEAAANAPDGYSVVPIYTTDWYVSPGGDDGALGYFPSSAKRMPVTMLLDPRVIAGDTVHAGPGVYDQGEACLVSGENATIPARAPVKDSVSFVADEGPEVTVIEGRGASDDKLDVDNEWKMGRDAVRCVWLGGRARVRGFTLRGGRTRCFTDGESSARHYSYDNSGGGVMGILQSPNGPYVENCTIVNCASYRGGAARYVTLVNCRIYWNYAHYNAAIAGESYLYGCIADNNFCPSAPLYNYYMIDNCTFGANNRVQSGGDQLVCISSPRSGSCVRNTIVLGPVEGTKETGGFYSNCFATSVSSPSDGLTIVPAKNLALDPAYRPIIGSCEAVNGGDISIVPDSIGYFTSYLTDKTTDAAGGQRVYQSVMDAGALEADWREIYARSLGRKIAVTKASEQVTVTESKRVRIPDGNVVEAVWNEQSPFDRKVSVSVTGSGTLTVRLNGEILGEQVGTGSKELVFAGLSDADALSFSYSGTDGYAEILRARLDRGLCIMVK